MADERTMQDGNDGEPTREQPEPPDDDDNGTPFPIADSPAESPEPQGIAEMPPGIADPPPPKDRRGGPSDAHDRDG